MQGDASRAAVNAQVGFGMADMNSRSGGFRWNDAVAGELRLGEFPVWLL